MVRHLRYAKQWENKLAASISLKSVAECLRVVTRRQQKGVMLPGMVISTDYRALVQALGGSNREDIREAVLLADHLQKTEGVRTVVQWLPSHLGVIGNENTDALANE
ncbi:RNA-directed DNA polymerase from [Plakobranchus ocellatus]|uniref:RNA-directed DNA polymerase from n=1 Tax=Plakobranchus ocellatus TaxID=259542 RepID=A0AAV3YV20_9GAST|nr:RNA-directed DNA polymerase from [Plakobranchus ocellatus]